MQRKMLDRQVILMLISLLTVLTGRPANSFAQDNQADGQNVVYLPFIASTSNEAEVVAAAVNLTSLGSAYAQNFDTLANVGTSSALPTDWAFVETGTNANTTYTAGTGSSTSGDTYSFGVAGSSERAFGGLRSGSLMPILGAQFINNTGFTITSLDITYTGEQWRAGVANRGVADRLDFQLSTDATSLTTGAWIDYNSLDLNSPNIVVASGALNGNTVGNQANINFTISDLNIANGAAFWIRWTDFDIASSDDGLAIDDFSLIPAGVPGSDTAPAVSSTDPANGALTVAENADLVVNFSEAVNVAGSWFTLACSTSGAHAASFSGGPTSFILNPDIDFGSGEQCTLTIVAANVTDQDSDDPPDALAADFTLTFETNNACVQPFTPIPAIQGSGPTAAITGVVTTKGVVVGDYEGAAPALRGFYLQDPSGDGNVASADGIFVFNGSNNSVNLGDLVYVTGAASEFQDQTQLSATSIVQCGTGAVIPVDVTFPVPSDTYLEQYEGMLVRLPQRLFVTEHFQLGRFGQVVMSAESRLKQPTSVVAPGTPALALQADNNLKRIIIDDELNNQNPDPIRFGRAGNPLSASNTLRGGDTATGIVGLMTYTWSGNAASGNAYRVRPINALGGAINFEPTNPRPATAPAVGGRLRVAGMNLLNFFNTFDGLPDNVDNCTFGVNGLAADCRGADTQAEFDRQWPKTVAAIMGTNADIIGINEIENDGYGPDSAIQFLVDKLNATAPGTYAFINVDAATGQVDAQGTDAIKVGLLYKPANVTPVGQTAVLNSAVFVNGGDSAPRSRPSLAQAFEENATGARFMVDVNHFKSKGSACDAPDAGDGQGNCNLVRKNAALELVAWLAGNPTNTGQNDVLIVGDLNSYAMEDPITVIKNAGYTNLIDLKLGPDAYSYVFDGQWGYLDYALGSASIVPQVVGVGDWHINADEPSVLDYSTDFKTANLIASLYAPDEFRISDHDPVIVGLNLNAPPNCANASPSIATLWPPNHQFVPISVLGVSDPEGDPIAIKIDSIFQDEAVNAPGSGNTSPDAQGVGAATAQVRAERAGAGNGRVYHIRFTARDGSGGACTSEVQVSVPHNKKDTAVDEGALYDSTVSVAGATDGDPGFATEAEATTEIFLPLVRQ